MVGLDDKVSLVRQFVYTYCVHICGCVFCVFLSSDVITHFLISSVCV